MSSLWFSVVLESILCASDKSTIWDSSTFKALAIHVADPCSAPAADCIPMRLISMDLMLGAFHVISAFFCTCCHRTYPFPTGLQIYPWPLHWITSPQVSSSLGPAKYYECLQAQFHPNLQRYHKRMPDFVVQQSDQIPLQRQSWNAWMRLQYPIFSITHTCGPSSRNYCCSFGSPAFPADEGKPFPR